jgi:hypothetical protein
VLSGKAVAAAVGAEVNSSVESTVPLKLTVDDVLAAAAGERTATAAGTNRTLETARIRRSSIEDTPQKVEETTVIRRKKEAKLIRF